MVQSVQRALRLLELLDARGTGGVMLTDLCAGTGLKAPTAHNLLATLLELGYADQDPQTRRYRLGERARSLGTGQATVARLSRAAAKAMQALHAAVNETVILAIDMDDQRHSILSYESSHELRVTASTGVDSHFYDTATGRMLLALRTPHAIAALVAKAGLPGAAWPDMTSLDLLTAALARIRAQGHAEFMKSASHVRALAVPVCTGSAGPHASLGLFYPTVRDRAGRREELLRRLHEAAEQIEDANERI